MCNSFFGQKHPFSPKSWHKTGTNKKHLQSEFINVGLVQNPSFFDHFKRRSENPKHTFGNYKDLILDLAINLFLPSMITVICIYA
jgi:hypothetical protein